MKSRTRRQSVKNNSSVVLFEGNVSEKFDEDMVDEDDENHSVEGVSKEDQTDNFLLPVIDVPNIDSNSDFVEDSSFGNKSPKPRSSCQSSQEGDPVGTMDEYCVFVPDGGTNEMKEDKVSPFASIDLQSTKPESSTTETQRHKESQFSEGVAEKISPLRSEEEKEVVDDDNDDFCFLCRDGGGMIQETIV